MIVLYFQPIKGAFGGVVQMGDGSWKEPDQVVIRDLPPKGAKGEFLRNPGGLVEAGPAASLAQKWLLHVRRDPCILEKAGAK